MVISEAWNEWFSRRGLLIFPSLLIPFAGLVIGFKNLREKKTRRYGFIYVALAFPWILTLVLCPEALGYS